MKYDKQQLAEQVAERNFWIKSLDGFEIFNGEILLEILINEARRDYIPRSLCALFWMGDIESVREIESNVLTMKTKGGDERCFYVYLPLEQNPGTKSSS